MTDDRGRIETAEGDATSRQRSAGPGGGEVAIRLRRRIIALDSSATVTTSHGRLRSILLRCLMAAGLWHLDTTPCLRRALRGGIDAMPKKTASIRS